MANYVLVHGSGHGAWCWQRIVPMLEAKGHNVVAVDLPGNGHDDTPLADVTLETYATHVCSVLDSLDGPAVLVGHSLGGISISRAAELRPNRVAVLVYLTAVLIPDGATFLSTISGHSDVERALVERTSWNLAEDRSYVTYKMDQTQHRFYNDCSPDDVAWAQSMVVAQPVGPLLSTMQVTDGNFGSIPRVYIECSQDNAVTPEFARSMYTALPCAEVITMDTGHSPFMSAPEDLTGHLHALARYAAASARA